jgi:hypothetical protein
MQPSHLPLVWLKTIEQLLVKKQLMMSKDKLLLKMLALVSIQGRSPLFSSTSRSETA